MIRTLYNSICFLLSIPRLIPHLIIFNVDANRETLIYDTKHWLNMNKSERNLQSGFIYLMTFYPEFRNLFYLRTCRVSKLFNFLCPKLRTLDIQSKNIGPGLFIQHGIATIIAVKSMGKNCHVHSHVSIGFASNNIDLPTIGDNVYIGIGARILGNVTVGSNTKIGANAVVVKNIPDNCTVVGVPAYIIRKNGVRTHEAL
ncbi:MAG TPA: serine acetyltransferase [Bacteroidales bacterium]|nr:serine acetyltransferase [Bacteroidales bacterium]